VGVSRLEVALLAALHADLAQGEGQEQAQVPGDLRVARFRGEEKGRMREGPRAAGAKPTRAHRSTCRDGAGGQG
jgi:hypothetical protein